MNIGLFIIGFVVLLLSVLITPIGTSNGLLISTILFVVAIVLSVFKPKKNAK